MESRERESVLKKIRIAALDAGLIIPPGGKLSGVFCDDREIDEVSDQRICAQSLVNVNYGETKDFTASGFTGECLKGATS